MATVADSRREEFVRISAHLFTAHPLAVVWWTRACDCSFKERIVFKPCKHHSNLYYAVWRVESILAGTLNMS